MFEKLVVLLDGSPLAETALPAATNLARLMSTRDLVVLRVEEDRDEAVAEYLANQTEKIRNSFEDTESAPNVRHQVIPTGSGGVAGTVLDFAESNAVDTIVMATHGRSGIDRWLMGSVAEKVLRGADIPVCLIRAGIETAPESTGIKKVLVPLDGSARAEQSLAYLAPLAGIPSSEALLLYVQPEPDEALGMPAGAQEMSAKQAGDIKDYLISLSTGLGNQEIHAHSEIVTGNPGVQIAQHALDNSVDLIVMASHGRSGLAEWAFGSVANQVLHSAPVPVLLVRSATDSPVQESPSGPMVYRCHQCGRRVHHQPVSPVTRCGRCNSHLKACGNCTHFDGMGCLLELPEAFDALPGNHCRQFKFRQTRLVLR